MTGNSQDVSRGYGPFRQGVDPGAQDAGHGPAAARQDEQAPNDPDRTAIVPPATDETAVIPAQGQPEGQTQPSAAPSSTTPASGAPTSAAPTSATAAPASATPASAAPTSAPPTSRAGSGDAVAATPTDHPRSAPAQPSGAPQYGPFHASAPPSTEPSSGRAYGAAPSSSPAYGAEPSSGPAYGAAPSSGGPFASEPSSGAPQWTGPPSEGAPGTVDAYGLPVTSSAGFDEYGLGPSSGTPRFGQGAAASDDDQYGPVPSSGAPSSGDRFGPVPSSGAPRPGGGGYADGDRFGFESAARGGPRIEPSPPKQRNKLVLGILAGLAAGLLIFGGGGFFLGRGTAGTAAPEGPGPQPTASVAPSLGVYEQNQVKINQAKLSGALVPISQNWVPYLSSCDRSGEPGGPGLNGGEKTRVRCRFDGMSMIFLEYATVADRDKARVKALSQNVDARTLTPGVGPAGDKATPSAQTSGSYIEYAYTVEENRVRQTVAGIWWDDTKAPVAVYLLAFWKTGIGEDWTPMRDLWGRYA